MTDAVPTPPGPAAASGEDDRGTTEVFFLVRSDGGSAKIEAVTVVRSSLLYAVITEQLQAAGQRMARVFASDLYFPTWTDAREYLVRTAYQEADTLQGRARASVERAEDAMLMDLIPPHAPREDRP